MGLTDLLLILKGDEDGTYTTKHIDMFFDEEGVSLVADEGEELSANEIHYVLAVAYIHVGAEIKGIILKPRDAAILGHRLYEAFHQSYKGIQTIEDMSLDDFNKYMVKHGL